LKAEHDDVLHHLDDRRLSLDKFLTECETYKTLEFLDKDKKNIDVPATERRTMEKWPGIPGWRFGTYKLKCDPLYSYMLRYWLSKQNYLRLKAS
jgi:hypothetical protein